MKKINFILIILFGLFFNSCNESKDIQFLNGYWEINSVSIDGKEIKNYPFSGTIDYFILDKNNHGFRKKVKPKIDGSFDITMHEIEFKIEMKKNDIYLVYGKGKNFVESIVKLDSTKMILKNMDGFFYEYKRFFPNNFLDE
tara:strand:- start:163 stop:585 length:423 start_codon:yes stop_codon:yes gene_type:complete